MSANNQDDNTSDVLADGLDFHFIKSNHFRTIYVDGAWGGLTPHLGIHMALFNERTPIPQQVHHPISSNGELGEEQLDQRITRTGVIREVEAELFMTIETAESLATFLKKYIDEAKKVRKEQSSKERK